MFNKGQLSGLMKQAQMMQENLKKAQEELAQMEVSGEAASGKVKVEMSCKHVVKRVHIDPSVMDDQEMLEDLLTAAFNDATRKVEQTSEQKMGKLSAGLPAGMKLPF
jgi:DNA-binding YbaB/EbfC family protein